MKTLDKSVFVGEAEYQAGKIILANGTAPRRLGIPGEEEFAGRGIGMNALRDGNKYRGKNIYVTGGADGAVKEALYLSQFAEKLTIIHFEDSLGCIAEFKLKVEKASNITIRLGTRLRLVFGDESVSGLELISEKEGRTERIQDPGCGIFVYAGTTPNTAMYGELLLENGYITVNEKMETSVPGVLLLAI